MAKLSGEAGAGQLDVALGARIRRFRKARRLSQERLADAVGVSFQQIQKYERGANRVSFSRLVLIAQALGASLPELIDGLGIEEAGPRDLASCLRTPGASELVQAYAAIRAEAVRRCLVELVRELAQSNDAQDEPIEPVEDGRSRPVG